LATAEPVIEVKPDTIMQLAAKKEEVKAPEVMVMKPETNIKSQVAKAVLIKPTIPTPKEYKDVVIYRVQFLSSPRQQKTNQVIVSGKRFETYEYFYLKEYRYTIGEFTTLEPAKQLQFAIRKSGYPNAFVAAFKNNYRSLDLDLFNKNPTLATEAPVIVVKPDTIKQPAVKNEDVKATEVTAIKTEPDIKSPAAKSALIKPTDPKPADYKDVVIYRVQFLSNPKPQKTDQITVNGKRYDTYEYFYLKEYRYTVGEFTTLQPAKELQIALKKSGYQSFVVAFKNNYRSMDPDLFR
jgi:hypothetical protein